MVILDFLFECWFGWRFVWWALCALAAGAIAIINVALQVVLVPLRLFEGPRRFAGRAWRGLADVARFCLEAGGSAL